MKNKPVPNDFDSIQTNHMMIGRVKTVNYLGLIIDENLYWNAHVDFVVCASLVKYFGIFNHIKSFNTSRIAIQLYFAFINFRISYGIEVYGHCADEYLSKLQTLQNKLLKLMLKLDRCTSTNQLHRNLSLLKIADIHTVSVLCFVNNCRAARCPESFCNYYQVRQTEQQNFAIKTTFMYPGLEPIWVLAHVTLKELDYGMKTFRQSIPIFIKNVSKQM